LRNLEKYNDLLKDEERNQQQNTSLRNKGYIVPSGKRNLEEMEYLKSLNLNDFENYVEEPKINQIEIEYSDFRTGSKTIAEVIGLQIINFDGINANEQNTKKEIIIEDQNLKIKRVSKPKPTAKLLYDEFIYSKLKNRNVISSSFSLIYDIKNLMKIKVDHLSPNRTRQDILYLKTRMNDTDIERVLAEYSAVPYKDSDPHQKFLSYWLKEFGIGDSINIETTKGIAYDVQIRNNKRIVSLVDMGFGTGQIITILIQLSTAIRTHSILINRSRKLYRYKYDFDSSYIIIEEPESNLHPQFQAKMAELIVECLKYGIKFILETHSEYFIGKFQVLVAESLKKENKLQKENIVIYYINDKTDDKTYLKEIFINNDGSLTESFGEGFTDVTTSNLKDLFKINKSRNSNDENI
jgi:predicted ATPase